MLKKGPLENMPQHISICPDYLFEFEIHFLEHRAHGDRPILSTRSGRWVIILAWVVEQSTYCNVDLQFQITRHRSDLNLEKVSRIFQIVLIAF